MSCRFAPPGAYPIPDNQGNGATCTRYALAKAACSGLHNGVWTSGQAMDINQEALSMSICQEFKNTHGAWPTKYDKTIILAFDKKSKNYFYLTLESEKVP